MEYQDYEAWVDQMAEAEQSDGYGGSAAYDSAAVQA